MSGLSLGRQKKKLVLIADIESGGVGMAAVLLSRGTPAQVLHQARTRTSETETSSQNQDAAQLLAAFSNVLSTTLKVLSEPAFVNQHGPVGDIYAVVGGSWLQSRTVHTTESYPEERTFRDQDIQALAKKALQEPSELSAAGLIETHVIRVHINGYATGKPVGKRGRTIGVTVFQSAYDIDLRKQIEQALNAQFPGRKVQFRSRVRALMTTLHERSVDIHHYFVVNVEDTVTTFLAVRKEEVTEHATLSEGVTTFARRFGSLNAPLEETASLVRLIGKDTCSTPACEIIRTNIARAESELTSIFGKTLGTLATHRKLPNHCVLIIDERYAAWCESFLSRIDFSQFTITAQPFIVESLIPEHLRPYVLFASGVQEDTGIALAAAFVHIQEYL